MDNVLSSVNVNHVARAGWHRLQQYTLVTELKGLIAKIQLNLLIGRMNGIQLPAIPEAEYELLRYSYYGAAYNILNNNIDLSLTHNDIGETDILHEAKKRQAKGKKIVTLLTLDVEQDTGVHGYGEGDVTSDAGDGCVMVSPQDFKFISELQRKEEEGSQAAQKFTDKYQQTSKDQTSNPVESRLKVLGHFLFQFDRSTNNKILQCKY
ncbi:hypothetical protein WN51_02160 [Melipona quadrifasciata]|uniref:Uncharacterized protein n=1 Tax=Melipona quadrifasciata TaxID=166423 RepID=A0A0M8ZVA7_9HYME|nr:hypothetical protein WN51_02160 [Melipona quadrifasciata]